MATESKGRESLVDKRKQKKAFGHEGDDERLGNEDVLDERGPTVEVSRSALLKWLSSHPSTQRYHPHRQLVLHELLHTMSAGHWIPYGRS